MSYIYTILSRPSRVSVDHGFVCASGSFKNQIPIEDLDTLLLDNDEIIVTLQSLRRLCKNGVSVIVCDEQHKPSGILMPFNRFALFK